MPGSNKEIDMKRLILVMLMFLACGCSFVQTVKDNNNSLLTLKNGQTKEEVLKIMGNPARNERYTQNDKILDVWYYRTGYDIYAIDENNFTPVIFKNDKLIGWGTDCYRQNVELAPISQ